MSKITKIGRPECARIRSLIEQQSDLREYLAEFGLKLDVGKMKYSDSDVKVQLTISLESYDAAREDFEMHCHLFDLEPSHYGAEFIANGERFRLTGLNINRPKYPFSATRVKDNKQFKFTQSIADKVRIAA